MNQEFDNELPKRHTKPFNSVTYWLLGCALTLLIASIIPFFFTQTCRGHTKSEAISNIKQIGLALFEFENDFEAYPNEKTARDITEAFPDQALDFSGKTSNAAFRQLIAPEIAASEEMFFAKIKGYKRPDGITTPGELLKKGEVGFSYISGLSSKDDHLTPIVLTPLIPGTTKFNPEPFDGKAIIFYINQSARTYDIAKDGHMYDKGIDILSAKHPIWKGKAPDIRYPE